MLNDARTQGVGGASVSSAFQQTPQLSPWHYSAFACRQWPITQGYLRRRRAVLRYSTAKTDPQSVWLQQLIARRGHNCAAVALANASASWFPIRDPWLAPLSPKRAARSSAGSRATLSIDFNRRRVGDRGQRRPYPGRRLARCGCESPSCRWPTSRQAMGRNLCNVGGTHRSDMA